MNADSKWTPGPWEVSIGWRPMDDIAIQAKGDGTICFLPCEFVANANLIATAPEMAKHLQAASHALRSYQYGNSATELAQGCADQIDALLAIARGESSASS